MQTTAHPSAESTYLAEARDALRETLGGSLIGVYAGGSWALGDYLPGRSDLDVAAVVRSPLSRELGREVARALRHEALPCPARSLELVIYRLDTARSGSAASEFELNLNTGRGTPLLVQSKSDPGDVGSHWFAIDRSILSQAGIALLGPPAGEVFAPTAIAKLVPTLAESVRWHREHRPGTSDAVLNACRSLLFVQEGRWSSKPRAGRWAVEHELAPADLVAQALTARTEGDALEATELATFLDAVEPHLHRHLGN